MTLAEDVISTPGSPPGMTASKSSKSSSLGSLRSDDNSVLDDASHFEDIGLEDDDDSRLGIAVAVRGKPHTRRSWSPELRGTGEKHVPARPVTLPRPPIRSLSTNPRPKPADGAHLRVNARPGAAGGREPRGLGIRSMTSSVSMGSSSRSPSPSFSIASTGGLSTRSHRRTSWQSAHGRKSVAELERECDEDDDEDDIPQHLLLDNIPISPRPPLERSLSQSSQAPVREQDKPKTVGNGTPAVAQAQGSLKSPDWKSDGATPLSSKGRARSWNAAMAELSPEAKALTEKLEEHAQELEEKNQDQQQQTLTRSQTWGGRPRTAGSGSQPGNNEYTLPRALPPVQRSIMIDPLPVSREKEAVLSRTRPSWLPPKDPAEERRHLREYRRMMARSADSERRREAARLAQTAKAESEASNMAKTWEQDILPRWDVAARERRTRQLVWKGVPPRSRGAVWTRAIGNSLELTETSYQAALGRAHQVQTRVQGARGDGEDGCKVAWFNAIRRDVSEKTWTDLRIFQPSGPLHQSLVDVLCAYSMYRSDIGYFYGCHTMAALLLLNLPSPPAAFIALANLLNRPLPLAFYSQDPTAKASVYNLVMRMLSRKSEALHFHLTHTLGHVDPDEYLCGVFRSLFTGHLGIDESARLWDVYVFEGDSVFVRAAVALLLEREMALLSTRTAGEVSDVLARAGVGTRKRAVGEAGAEDKWIEAVQDAGV